MPTKELSAARAARRDGTLYWALGAEGRMLVYTAPGRATDLSGLPPVYIEVGSAETFRDENVAYASKLWASGIQAELHVWPGAYHRFQAFAPPTLPYQRLQMKRDLRG
jgi:acetyl esterase/lipase